MGLFNIFKKKNLGNDLENIAIKGYRKYAKDNECAPTSKTSDEKIIEITREVMTAFTKISEKRNENLPGAYKHFIVIYFLQAFEMIGEKYYREHLEYELDKFLNEGLRDDFKIELNIFN